MSDAFDSFVDLRRRLYRMLDAGVSQTPRPAEGFAPPLDVVSTPEGLTITVEVPGMAREDIAVELQGNLLTIAGERRTGREDAQQRFFRRERPSGHFKRSLALPTTDHEELSAALKDGVLTVTVHKPGRGM